MEYYFQTSYQAIKIGETCVKKKPFKLTNRVFIISSASVVGKKEKMGPLGNAFDLSGDDRFGKDTWEKAESEMQRLAISIALNKCALSNNDIDILCAGDLINQCISSSYGLSEYHIPYLGIFGACSTCAEGILMSAIYASYVCDRCATVTSSHYCSAERQFRYPLEYGGQRTPTSQWTVTGSGAFIVSSLLRDIEKCPTENIVEIADVMPGCIVDRGISDANNMGAAMAPSAAETLERYFCTNTPDDFDMIITGDLGREGSGILLDLLSSKSIDLSKNHVDCGNMIYTSKELDTHAGGSGCGCSAVVMAADIIPNLEKGVLKNILFIGTGALMNPLSINQGQTIPGIAHLVHLRSVKKESIIAEMRDK